MAKKAGFKSVVFSYHTITEKVDYVPNCTKNTKWALIRPYFDCMKLGSDNINFLRNENKFTL